MDKQTLFRFMAGIKGASASILLALLLADRPLTRDELELITGYSGLTVGRGLDVLQARQLVSGDGVQGFRATPAELHDSPSSGVQGFRAMPAELQDSPSSDSRLSTHSPPDELINKFFLLSSSSSPQEATLSLPEGEEEEEEERQKILHLLAQSGISPKSRKGQEILAAGLSVEFVAAHVAAREAMLARAEPYPASWLITKLLDGDPAPTPTPCRCGRCEACKQRTYAQFPHIKR